MRHWYYDLTGYPLLPARWTLGPWLWRDENEDQTQVESDIQTMRDLDLPASGIWIDRPYASAVNTWGVVRLVGGYSLRGKPDDGRGRSAEQVALVPA